MADAPAPGAAKPPVLKAKVGPLTGLQWALLIGGALGLYFLWKKRQQAASSTTAATSPDLSGVGLGGPVGSSFGGGGGGSTVGTSGTYLTNQDWLTSAVNSLIGHGYDPALATSALSTYLAGGQLTQQMQAALDDALRYAGAPPSPVPFTAQPVVTPSAIGPAALSEPPPRPAQPVSSGPPPAFSTFGTPGIPGEQFVKEVQDPAGGWLALTNYGGVFTEGGAPFYGSYIGYVNANPQTASWGEKVGAGNAIGPFTDIIAGPGGTYTEVAKGGQRYNFGPGTPRSGGGVA